MKNYSTFIFIILILSLFSACTDDSTDLAKLKVNVFGYSDGEFTPTLPGYADASKISLKVTEPATGKLIGESVFDITDGSGKLPSLNFEENIRLDFNVLDAGDEVIASGATPTFDVTPGQSPLDFRVQVQSVGTFAPFGSIVIDRETNGRRYAQSVFDYRGESKSWLGRMGHQAAILSDGRVLVVGGGDPAVPGELGGSTTFRNLYDDVQIFDPQTGYFSNLDYDDATSERLNSEKLKDPVVFHTLTKIGEDRFIVTGGYTKKVDQLRPVNTIQIIDLNQPVGERVKLMLASDGSSVTLLRGRAHHTASFRQTDNKLIVAGGVGPASPTEALKSFEIIDVENNAAGEDTFTLKFARTRHVATVLADGTIWLSGGIDETNILKTTESISGDSSTEEGKMKTGRFGHVAFVPTDATGLLAVVGGFTDLDGTATDSYEFAKTGRGDFEASADWVIPEARGGIDGVKLDTGEVLIFGGRTKGENSQESVVRLTYLGLSNEPPFETRKQGKQVDTRTGPTVTMLTSGRVLLIGGSAVVDGNSVALDSAEVFNP